MHVSTDDVTDWRWHVLIRRACVQGVTQRDAKAVQKHFEHLIMHNRMHVLFRAFRRRGFLTDIIDSINICTDFGPRPLPGARSEIDHTPCHDMPEVGKGGSPDCSSISTAADFE